MQYKRNIHLISIICIFYALAFNMVNISHNFLSMSCLFIISIILVNNLYYDHARKRDMDKYSQHQLVMDFNEALLRLQ
jgi:hypothetical protein